MIREMYESVKVCVRSMHKLSNFFENYVGVKQGATSTAFIYYSY